jgi:hypothetical protein
VHGGALFNERSKKNAMQKILGRTSMEMLPRQQERPDVSIEQRRSSELVKLVRKLRWMGMEADAERVESTLSGLSPADSVLVAPHETD